MNMTRDLKGGLLLGLVAALGGCGDRSERWDQSFSSAGAVQLGGAVAVVDEGSHQAIFLSAPSGLELTASYVPVGSDVGTVRASQDGSRVFLLSRGEQPRREPDDQKPRFTVIDTAAGSPSIVREDDLEQALTGLALDPDNEWAVIYAGPDSSNGFVTNPNELILVSLSDPTLPPQSKTLRSEGGQPLRLQFTRPLHLPDGSSRRFLIVEREHDLALVDLVDLDRSDITVGSPQNQSEREAAPAEVVYYPGDDENNAQFAVRYSDDHSVGVLELHDPENAEQLFSLSYNLVDVGGVASAIEFVRTDAGVRLAAVVPATSSAVLVDTVTSETTLVDLDYAYTGLELVTDDVAARPDQSDVALLYSNQATAVGFWALGKTSGQPYRSLDSQDIGASVSQVHDVPGEDFAHYKILKSASGGEFFVLDLNGRESYPMQALTALELRVAPDGQRLWAFQPGGTNLARVTFDDLHPVSLSTEMSIDEVFDIAHTSDSAGRSVIALHLGGLGLGATVFDALAPDTARSRFYSGFEFGGIR
jgi:hypothetical protein